MNITIKHTQTTETTETINLPHYRIDADGDKLIAIFSEENAIEVRHWKILNAMQIRTISIEQFKSDFGKTIPATEDEYNAFLHAYTMAHDKLMKQITEWEDAPFKALQDDGQPDAPDFHGN